MTYVNNYIQMQPTTMQYGSYGAGQQQMPQNSYGHYGTAYSNLQNTFAQPAPYYQSYQAPQNTMQHFLHGLQSLVSNTSMSGDQRFSSFMNMMSGLLGGGNAPSSYQAMPQYQSYPTHNFGGYHTMGNSWNAPSMPYQQPTKGNSWNPQPTKGNSWNPQPTKGNSWNPQPAPQPVMYQPTKYQPVQGNSWNPQPTKGNSWNPQPTKGNSWNPQPTVYPPTQGNVNNGMYVNTPNNPNVGQLPVINGNGLTLEDGTKVNFNEGKSEVDISGPNGQGSKLNIWGDPHLKLNGKKVADFYENARFNLQNGYSMVVQPVDKSGAKVGTERGKNKTWSSEVLLYKDPAQAVHVTGLASSRDGKNNLNIQHVGSNYQMPNTSIDVYETPQGWRLQDGSEVNQKNIDRLEAMPAGQTPTKAGVVVPGGVYTKG